MKYENDIRAIHNKNVLFIDLETTGFPAKKHRDFRPYMGHTEYYDTTMVDKYEGSRIVQVAWWLMKVDNNITNYDVSSYIRKPNGFDIPHDSTLIHGIDTTMAKQKGYGLKKIMNYFGLKNAIMTADYLVAYNACFDINVLMSELYRYNWHKTYTKMENMCKMGKIICVGELMRDIAKIHGFNGYLKMPRLFESYKHFYGKPFENMHNAKYDVIAMIEICEKMLQLIEEKKIERR